MRASLIAGNWKMNGSLQSAIDLVEAIMAGDAGKAELAVCPPAVHLMKIGGMLAQSKIALGAQNVCDRESGAFTGEISAEMLTSLGLKTVILGHSERREYFGETDALLAEKVDAALENNLEAIFCFGEVLEDRKSDNHFSVVKSQIEKGLFHLDASQWSSIVLAYEPVWAIGTGKTATPQQAQDVHAFIRGVLEEAYDADVASQTQILYGGSVKPDNSAELMGQTDIDGALVGGASLDADSFAGIINSSKISKII